jgi:transcriptional regulator with XRE-family HTH domain
VSFTSIVQHDAATVATNLRHHMAREGLTFEDIVTATELDERTVRGLVRGNKNPHARTLHKLARGLGLEMSELFRTPACHASRQLDRAANLLVQSFVAEHPRIFERWSPADFDELYSRFGTGGPLTEAGIATAAQAMNAKRDVQRQVNIILESGEAELLSEFVDMLYRRITARPEGNWLQQNSA